MQIISGSRELHISRHPVDSLTRGGVILRDLRLVISPGEDFRRLNTTVQEKHNFPGIFPFVFVTAATLILGNIHLTKMMSVRILTNLAIVQITFSIVLQSCINCTPRITWWSRKVVS